MNVLTALSRRYSKGGTRETLVILCRGEMRAGDPPALQLYQLGGMPWVAYEQFCRTFLFPLMLTAYKRVDFQPFLRSYLDGIPAEDMARLFGWSSACKPGVFAHIKVHSLFERHFGRELVDLRSTFSGIHFSRKSIARLITKLERVISGLRYRQTTVWSDYQDSARGDPVFRGKKRAFVQRALMSSRTSMIWDLGCNVGEYAKLAGPHAQVVIAADADPSCVNRLYLDQRSTAAASNILALVIDLANPSPNLGWNLCERSSLLDRGRPDLVLALALIHHLVISRNVPVEDFIEFLRSLAPRAVVEFVTKEDPMVRALLQHRDDVFDDYTVDRFEALAGKRFRVLDREGNNRCTRILYHLEPLT